MAQDPRDYPPPLRPGVDRPYTPAELRELDEAKRLSEARHAEYNAASAQNRRSHRRTAPDRYTYDDVFDHLRRAQRAAIVLFILNGAWLLGLTFAFALHILDH